MVFPVVVYGCESWTIKKAEHRRIAAFELWCWRRPFRVPWNAKRWNQSILKEISPEYSLEDAEAETPIIWPPDSKNWLTGKDPDAGKIEGRKEGDDRGWDGWMASPTQWTWVWVNSGSWWWHGTLACCSSGSQRVRHDWVTELHNLVCVCVLQFHCTNSRLLDYQVWSEPLLS